MPGWVKGQVCRTDRVNVTYEIQAVYHGYAYAIQTEFARYAGQVGCRARCMLHISDSARQAGYI